MIILRNKLFNDPRTQPLSESRRQQLDEYRKQFEQFTQDRKRKLGDKIASLPGPKGSGRQVTAEELKRIEESAKIEKERRAADRMRRLRRESEAKLGKERERAAAVRETMRAAARGTGSIPKKPIRPARPAPKPSLTTRFGNAVKKAGETFVSAAKKRLK